MGIPVYTLVQDTEKNVTQLKEAYDLYTEMIPDTPKKWNRIAQDALTGICTGAAEVQQAKEQFKAFFSEEGMEELHYQTGYVGGSIEGMAFEELLEGCLGLELLQILDPSLLKAADAADTLGDGIAATGKALGNAIDEVIEGGSDVWDMTEGDGIINGREYSQHAMERMAPNTPSVIEDDIRNTTAVPGHTAGTFVHQTADVTVIVNEMGKVITVIPM